MVPFVARLLATGATDSTVRWLMSIFDLVFALSFVTAVGTIVRVGYLFARRRSRQAIRVSTRLGVCTAAYGVVLVTVSAIQPTRTIGLGEPQCFDDFCVAIDGATRQAAIDTVTGQGDFVVVKGRTISRAGRRRQRETDIYGLLLDDRGGMHHVSERGENALRRLGLAGAELTDFVDPYGANSFTLAFEVPSDSRSFNFVTAHGAFPGALIIGGQQSLFHRPSIVPLPLGRARSSSR